LGSASIPATKEPSGLVRQDGKWPDEFILIPWQGGKLLAWDVMLAQSYVDRAATGVGMVAELAAERKLMKYSNLPSNLIFQPIVAKTSERSAHRPQTLPRPLVIKAAVCQAKKEKLHSYSSICLWQCNDSMQFFCTTSSIPRMIQTNSHISTVFIAFNPWELYTQAHKK